MKFHIKRRTFWIGLPVVIVLGLGLGLRALWVHDSGPRNQPMGEQIGPYEDAYTAEIIEGAVELSLEGRASEVRADPGPKAPTIPANDPGFKPTTYLRDVHAKSHGCVLANFTVKSGLDPRFAQGVFAQPKRYDAIVRFSGGQPGIHSDSEKDAQGMAIKLLNVPGKKLLPGDEDDPAQDFVLMSSPVFFIRTLPEYAAFSRALGANPSFPSAYFFPSVWRPSTWHLREMWLALGTKKARPDSELTTRYWSASAYYLGPTQFVKYSAKPCESNHPLPPADRKSPDYLRLELANQAKRGGACFDFMVQPQVAGADMPVEDTTVRWDETVSPFVPVAQIEIPAQDNNTAAMNDRCENLEFNPWHALPAHRPAGVMNRVRGALYAAMASYRRSKNGVTAPGR